jgi:hypothetical protein
MKFRPFTEARRFITRARIHIAITKIITEKFTEEINPDDKRTSERA